MQRTISSLIVVVAVFMAAIAGHSPAAAFSDQEIESVFKKLDTDGDGKVTREEYDTNKVDVIYRDAPANTNIATQWPTFKDTRVSRQYFDLVDTNHDGKLSPIEVMDALAFEKIDKDNKGYITRQDLQTFMKEIGR